MIGALCILRYGKQIDFQKEMVNPMLYNIFNDNIDALRFIYLGGVILTFIVTFILLKKLMDKLPTDIGRAYAVNAEKAKGKPRGAGVIIIPAFFLCSLLFAPLSLEYLIYGVLLVIVMLTGFLDDASKNPWSDYKKGALDLILSIGLSVTYTLYNGSAVRLSIISSIAGKSISFTLPTVVYIILGTILVWMSINVVNCTDGVDGLCTSLSMIVLVTFFMITPDMEFLAEISVLAGALAAYLWFNSSPSQMLMGDAGSRPIGVFLALAAMKSGDPFVFLILCLIFILDGGLGLVKIFLLRFFKISIFKNTRMPLHDHARKNKGWSDTQTVLRFCILQFLLSAVTLLLF